MFYLKLMLYYLRHPVQLLKGLWRKVKRIPPVHAAGVTAKGMLHATRTEARVDELEQEKAAAEAENRELKDRIRRLEALRDLREVSLKGTWLREAAQLQADEPERIEVYRNVIDQNRREDEVFQAVDLGCGQGETLAALEELGIQALGVDDDAAAVSACTEKKLTAVYAEPVTWLRNCQSRSADLITMIHLTERLEPEQVCRVLEETARVLREDGTLIVELADPEQDAEYSMLRDPAFATVMTPETLIRLAGHAGLKSAETVRIGMGNSIVIIRNESDGECS